MTNERVMLDVNIGLTQRALRTGWGLAQVYVSRDLNKHTASQ